MPLLLPKPQLPNFYTPVSGDISDTTGVALTSAASAHTLPAAFTEIIASTSFDTNWVEVLFHNNSGSNTRTDSLVNIYVGAGGSEQLLIPNLLAGWTAVGITGAAMVKRYMLPLRIPAGSRISGKHQSVRTATAVYCIIRLWGGGGDHWVGTKVECVGADTANSRGTSVTMGSNGVAGTYTSIGTNTFEWGYTAPMLGGNVTDTTMSQATMQVDLGSGVATSILGLQQFLFMNTATEFGWAVDGGRFGRVPSGTTLYLRGTSNVVGEANDFCIYGVH